MTPRPPLACDAATAQHACATMPGVLTRPPDTVIQFLRSGGAECGEGAPQKI
ncbi:hypothetical protein [Nannocystis radixulma]|uniref:Uncharacterized protein n=1 Tax=Nannocystis radixulma TaxID=2995305 RepID=A0ABT5B2C5_9BACT|nr:hypothetical protein [Nannocystis radixulma]MDC0667825.1 hypothetical protein [Nannocystis radixulma]